MSHHTLDPIQRVQVQFQLNRCKLQTEMSPNHQTLITHARKALYVYSQHLRSLLSAFANSYRLSNRIC